MRPVGVRRLTRYPVARVVAAKPMAVGDATVNNLLWLANFASVENVDESGANALRVTVLRDWEGSVYRGGHGGSRDVPFVSAPFIAA